MEVRPPSKTVGVSSEEPGWKPGFGGLCVCVSVCLQVSVSPTYIYVGECALVHGSL